jgi:hypothetical protein
MGVIKDHDLQSFIDKGYTIFAETGTGNGTAMRYADAFNFDILYSCDIDIEQIKKLTEEFKGKSIVLFASNSVDYIKNLFDNEYIKNNQKVVWFLDSHFPGFDLHGAAIDAEKNLDIRLPLHSELQLLEKYGRDNDVIICDDLRIYEKGPFAGKNMDEIGYAHAAAYDWPLPLEGWDKTHDIKRDYRDTGYLVLTPKNL